MTRLIDADKLKEDFNQEDWGTYNDSDVKRIIDNAPTIEPQIKNVPVAEVIIDDDKLQEIVNGVVEQIKSGEIVLKEEGPTDKWGKWLITEIRCPNCLVHFQTDCYSTEELNKCPVCGLHMRGAES